MDIALATTARVLGGVWRNMQDLGLGLQARGHHVTLGLREDATALHERAGKVGLRWLSIERSVAQRGGVWHLHLDNSISLAALPLMLRRRRHGSIVVTEHLPRTNATVPGLDGSTPRPGAYWSKRHYKQALLGLTDCTIAVSEASRRFLIATYGIADADVVTVHNGMLKSEGSVVPTERPPGAPLEVLAVGAVIMQKGHDLLPAAAEFATEPWRVRIVGEGPHSASLAAEIARLGTGRLELLGWRDDVPDLLATHHAVVMPSRWEAFGYAALEAAAAALPVIASAVDGLPEIVVNERTGLLVPPEDPRALAAALDRLARDEALRYRLGVEARSLVGRFTVEDMVSDTEAVYETVLRSRSAREGRDDG